MDTFEKYLGEATYQIMVDGPGYKAIKYKDQSNLRCCVNCKYGNDIYDNFLCMEPKNFDEVEKAEPDEANEQGFPVNHIGICPRWKKE